MGVLEKFLLEIRIINNTHEVTVTMKILMVGRDLPFNAEYFYRKAFLKLGHEVHLVNSYSYVGHHFLSRLIHSRTTLFDFTLKSLWINSRLKKIAEEVDPDIIIIFKGDIIATDVISELSHNWEIYLFYPDTYKFKPLLRHRLEYFNAVFTASNNRNLYYDFGARRAVTIPWACDPEFHRKIEINQKYKVAFIGTAYPERRKILRNVKEADVFGDFWIGFWHRSHPAVYGDRFVTAINQTMINLNLQAKISIEADAPTMRTFEIAGCGSFQISDFMPSLVRYFPDIVTFRDTKELRELINYYLDNYPEAQEIAIKTMEICRSSFKYTDSAAKILNSM